MITDFLSYDEREGWVHFRKKGQKTIVLCLCNTNVTDRKGTGAYFSAVRVLKAFAAFSADALTKEVLL